VPTAYPESYEQLRAVDSIIERWVALLQEEAEHIDAGQLERIVKTAKQLASRLDANLPDSFDPAAVAEIRRIILEGYRRVEEDDARPLDVLDDLMVRAESIRHIVRDALDEDLGPDQHSRARMVAVLAEWLPGVTILQLGELLHVDARTIHRWRASDSPADRRLVLTTRLVAILRFAWTPAGVVAWFFRPHPGLDGQTPDEVLEDPAFERALFAFARHGRAQHGS
jgi:hypothetical protein